MTIVQNTAQLPGQTPAGDIPVIVSLISTAFDPTGQAEIILQREIRTDRRTGMWQIDLIPNSQLEPTGTAYQVREGHRAALTFVVPVSSSPVWLFDCLVEVPTTPQVIGSVRYDAAQSLTGPQRAQALANVGADPAGAGAAAVSAERGIANGIAPLDGTGLVPRVNLPNISGVIDYAGVANQAAMLALTADPDTQLRVLRTDTPGVQWVLNPGLSPATLANWLQEPFDPSGAAAAIVNDAVTGTGTAWSSSKVATQLGAYAPLASPALTGSATLNGNALVDRPTAQGIALVQALIFGRR